MKKRDVVHAGVIGLGERGAALIRDILLEMQDVEITAICDIDHEKNKASSEDIFKKTGKHPFATTDYAELVARDDVDAVMVFASWDIHIKASILAMKLGKYVGMEVGGAENIDDCYKLVEAYEQTGTPVMMLENCCYGRAELMALKLVREGMFGDVVHCAGAYAHDLREAHLIGPKSSPYRLEEYRKRNGDLYPTHDLGPIAKLLKINRGNRMLYLTCMASKQSGIRDYMRGVDQNDPRLKKEYALGDIVITSIKCENGETIKLELDTTLPRAFYSRDFTVRGTKAMYAEQRQVLFFDGDEEEVKFNQDEMFKKHDHPLWAEYSNLGERGTHSGIDWLVFRAFFESVKNGTNTPIDVYDAAAWMAITPLSELSVKQGSAPVDIPDFTNGKYKSREPAILSKYCLDEVVEDKTVSIY